jgi:hypothetical protein
MIELWLSTNRFASQTTAPRVGRFCARLCTSLVFILLKTPRNPVVVLFFLLLATEQSKGPAYLQVISFLEAGA